MKKIAIIGHGYVGDAVFKFFKDHFDVCVVDPKYADFEEKKIEANAADLAIICVPTPQGEDGSVDLSIVSDSIDFLKTPLILIKSTVPPGTVRDLVAKTGKSIAFSPEYIGEGKYEVPFWKGYPDPTDMKKHSFVTMGGHPLVVEDILEYFKVVLGAEAFYFKTDSTTAELTKYMENAFLATKVTFCNEFAEIARTFGVDYDVLREAWLLDGRIGRSHTAVFKDKRGFGGKCLPKDVNGIVKASELAGYEPKLIKEVLASNDYFVGLNDTPQE